jgi:hypothetical protein
MTGTRRAPVTAPRRESDATIGRAVGAAALVALPRTIDAARQRALVLARATPLTLDAVESVDGLRDGPYLTSAASDLAASSSRRGAPALGG